MYVENGLPPHLRVVNTTSGAVEVDHELEAKSATDKGTVHAQFYNPAHLSAGRHRLTVHER